MPGLWPQDHEQAPSLLLVRGEAFRGGAVIVSANQTLSPAAERFALIHAAAAWAS